MDQKRARALKQLKALSEKPKEMRLAAEGWSQEWQILISTIMSARTRDEVTIPVAHKLFAKYPSIEKLSKAKTKDVEGLIRPVNFYRNKSKSVIGAAKKIAEDFNGKVPHKIEDLISIPGVGSKTANVFLSEVGKDAIGVDTHLAYISQKLGWTKNKNPDKIQKDLEKLFPKKYWSKINQTLVRFGKSHTSRKEKNMLLDKIKKIK